jgi:hypothetical protein
MAEDVQRRASSPPPVYTDTPPKQTSGGASMLILGVNILLLAAAIGYVVWKSRHPDGGKDPSQAGMVRNPDGSVRQPDGSVRMPDGSVRMPDGSVRSGGGSDAGIRAPRTGDTNPLFEDGALGSRKGEPRPGSGETIDPKTGKIAPAKPASPYLKRPRPAVQMSGEDRRRAKELTDGIERIGPGLEVTRTVSGAYPSSKGDAADANRGIEALTAYLREKGRLDTSGLRTGDTDADGKAELLDPWGRPLIYFSNDDYQNPQQMEGVRSDEAGGADHGNGRDRTQAYAQQRAGENDGGPVAPLGGRDAFDDGNWQAAARYQLWSAGPDGIDDGGFNDDIASWYLR